MGGRGASSGISAHGHIYGSDYMTVLKYGNIKFVKKKRPDAETILETKTANRVYVYIDNTDKISSIIYMGKDLMKNKSVDVDHAHDGEKPHTHHGYFHSENDSQKGYSKPSNKEKRMVVLVNTLWQNRNSK